MLRRKEDMKEWQKESAEEIKGRKAPDWTSFDDAPEVPKEAITEVKPVKQKKSTAKKKEAKKVEKQVEEVKEDVQEETPVEQVEE